MLFKSIASEARYRVIVSLLGEGKSRDEICNALGIDEQTYYKYVQAGVKAGHLSRAVIKINPAYQDYLQSNSLSEAISQYLNDHVGV